jgi:hypothetical protein
VVLWLCVCVERIACFACLMSVRDGERLGVSGNASVSAVLFGCVCMAVLPRTLNLLLYIAAHAEWSAFPPPDYVPCAISLFRPRMRLTNKLSMLKVTPCQVRYILERSNWLVKDDAMLDQILK